MKFLRNTLSLLVFWAVLSSPSAAQDAKISFVPRGINTSVNEHQAEPGMASYAMNWHKPYAYPSGRDGFSVWTTGINDGVAAGQFTGIYQFYTSMGTKRLFATFVYDDTTATFKGYPYSFILKSAEFGRNITATNAHPFNYATGDLFCATYNNTMFMGRKYGRPLRFNGNLKPLVEPPPGTWEYTPMAETTSTTNLLDGRYYYAMRNKVIEIASGTSDTSWVYIGYADSLNLHALSYEVWVDSDWVFIHSPELIPTSNMLDYDTTILQICRTRADRTPDDSFFLVGEYQVKDDTNGMLSMHFIDSIKDATLGTGTHVFCGFVDTVYRTQDTSSGSVLFDAPGDSALRLGVPKWKSTLSSTTNPCNGISEGYASINDTGWQATLYAIAYYDSATGSVSPMGSAGRVPVAYRSSGPDTIRDTAIQIYIPPMPTHKRHLWRLLCRAQEEETRVKQTDTTKLDWYRAVWVTAENKDDYNWSDVRGDYSGGVWRLYGCYDGGEVVQRDDGSYWCRGAIRTRDTTLKHTYYSAFRIIDTIKTNTDTIVSITYTDTLSWSSWNGKPKLIASEYIGPLNYPVVLNDRILMASRDNKVYFSHWGEYTSEVGIFQLDFSVNRDDGDEITGMIVENDAILITKNNSIFRATEAGTDEYNVQTYAVGIGCIAPRTLVHVPGGGIAFLHTSGLQVISGPLQSQYKESGGTMPPSISGPIQSFLDAYDIDDLRKAVIWFDEDEHDMILSFPTLDTSFVLSGGEWWQWDFAPEVVVSYDTAYSTDSRPDKQRLFTLDGMGKIYKMGGIKTDTGASVTKDWRSLDMAHGDPIQVVEFELWKWSDDTGAVSMTVYDAEGDSAAYKVDSTQDRVRTTAINAPETRAFKVRIKSTVDSLAVERVNIGVQPRGKPEIH